MTEFTAVNRRCDGGFLPPPYLFSMMNCLHCMPVVRSTHRRFNPARKSRGLTLPGLGWLLLATLLPAAAADFFVTPNGHDGNPGSEERPFATLTRARDAVRAQKQRVPNRDYEVVLRGGLYRVSETVVFSLADSAADGHTITYAAQPGETPVFTAAVPLAGWQRGGALWSAKLPAGMRPFLTLADRAGRLPRARTAAFSPSKDYRAIESLYRFTLPFPPGAVQDWPDLAEAELVIRPNFGWILNLLPIESVDVAAGLAEGQEQHSRFADPLFVNPDLGDCRFAPGSPAPALGIEPVDLRRVGLRR